MLSTTLPLVFRQSSVAAATTHRSARDGELFIARRRVVLPGKRHAAARHAEHHFAGGVHRVVAHQVAAYHAARRIRQSRVEVTPECGSIKLNSDRTPIK